MVQLVEVMCEYSGVEPDRYEKADICEQLESPWIFQINKYKSDIQLGSEVYGQWQSFMILPLYTTNQNNQDAIVDFQLYFRDSTKI